MKCSDRQFKPAFAFALFLFSSLILSACSQSESEEHEFNYKEGSGRGPSHWGSLKPEWRICSVGRQQSPINIGRVRVRSLLGDLRRNYSSASGVLRNRTADAAVVWLGNAGSITINGIVYRVVNCHWHSPSEHSFNGTRLPLELHIVHRSAQNRTAVVAIPYRFGLPDPFLFRLFGSILTLGLEERQVGRVNPEGIGFPGRRYYRYMGSLTTPPCSQGVVWTVFQKQDGLLVSGCSIKECPSSAKQEEFKANSTTEGKNRLAVQSSKNGYFYLKIDDCYNMLLSNCH